MKSRENGKINYDFSDISGIILRWFPSRPSAIDLTCTKLSPERVIELTVEIVGKQIARHDSLAVVSIPVVDDLVQNLRLVVGPGSTPDLIDAQNVHVRVPGYHLPLGGKVFATKLRLMDVAVDFPLGHVQGGLSMIGRDASLETGGHEVCLTEPGGSKQHD